MKKTILLVLIVTSSMMVFAQDYNHRNPPSTVTLQWQKDYPNYQNDKWEWRNNQWHTRYADKDHNNRMVDVYYDTRGRRIYSQSPWDRNEVPDAVANRIRMKYHTTNYTVVRMDRPGRGFYYQIRIGRSRVIYMNEKGKELYF